MGTSRKMQMFVEREPQNFPGEDARSLGKKDLGGVIFGCKNNTMAECLRKQLFGLPAQHYVYVQNIDHGLPLFLFNYTGRTLHGIFEAASHGQMNIDPYAWTTGGSVRTQYPAQVLVRVRKECPALVEAQFKPIILDNYYSHNHFRFELDHAQTSNIISVLLSLSAVSKFPFQQNPVAKEVLFRAPFLPGSRRKHEGSKSQSSVLPGSFEERDPIASLHLASSLDDRNFLEDSHKEQHIDNVKEKQRLCMKLNELASSREYLNPSTINYMDNETAFNNLCLEDTLLVESQPSTENNSDENLEFATGLQYSVTQLIQEMEQLKAFKTEQAKKAVELEQKMVEAKVEIQRLKDRCTMLESLSNLPLRQSDVLLTNSARDLEMRDELIYLAGGYDGVCWLSILEAYSPSKDVIESLKPMSAVRSYAAAAKLNGELYVFGGGNGHSLWYDSVESYDPAKNNWVSRPSLIRKKGSLAGVTLNNRIFAIGGGNGSECFSDVEMFDPYIGRWITARSMINKRFAPAAVELNGALYAVGGYDGTNYLSSTERFDPREHSWAKVASMNSKRGCHSMVVLNEKIYALGGYDGDVMVPSIEMFDSRIGAWIVGEAMNEARGYSDAVVLKNSIFVLGGLKNGDVIVDTVESYEEGSKWQSITSRAIGMRCFFSAAVL